MLKTLLMVIIYAICKFFDRKAAQLAARRHALKENEWACPSCGSHNNSIKCKKCGFIRPTIGATISIDPDYEIGDTVEPNIQHVIDCAIDLVSPIQENGSFSGDCLDELIPLIKERIKLDPEITTYGPGFNFEYLAFQTTEQCLLQLLSDQFISGPCETKQLQYIYISFIRQGISKGFIKPRDAENLIVKVQQIV